MPPRELQLVQARIACRDVHTSFFNFYQRVRPSIRFTAPIPEPCGPFGPVNMPGHRAPANIPGNRSDGARHFDLRLYGAELRFPPPQRFDGPPKKIPDRTAENIAAAAAIGLAFWAEHPKPNHLWALDNDRVVHIIRIDRKGSEVHHECPSNEDGTQWTFENKCPRRFETGNYIKPDDLDSLAAVMELPFEKGSVDE